MGFKFYDDLARDLEPIRARAQQRHEQDRPNCACGQPVADILIGDHPILGRFIGDYAKTCLACSAGGKQDWRELV